MLTDWGKLMERMDLDDTRTVVELAPRQYWTVLAVEFTCGCLVGACLAHLLGW